MYNVRLQCGAGRAYDDSRTSIKRNKSVKHRFLFVGGVRERPPCDLSVVRGEISWNYRARKVRVPCKIFFIKPGASDRARFVLVCAVYPAVRATSLPESSLIFFGRCRGRGPVLAMMILYRSTVTSFSARHRFEIAGLSRSARGANAGK